MPVSRQKSMLPAHRYPWFESESILAAKERLPMLSGRPLRLSLKMPMAERYFLDEIGNILKATGKVTYGARKPPGGNPVASNRPVDIDIRPDLCHQPSDNRIS